MKKKLTILAAFLLALPVSAQTDGELEQMVEQTLRQMTLEEKVRLSYAQSKFTSPGVQRLGIPELHTSDGPHGVRMEINWNDWNHAQWTNDACTAFPALTCLAATWNPTLAELYGKMVGEEARYRGKSVLLGPGVNLYRTPLNGRNFEYMGEDPLLASRLCVPYIQGLQSNGVACCVKHYALNEQEEFRGHVDVRVSDRALYELYLRPFEAAVREGKAWSIMGAYNQYLNQHASHHKRLINDILKGEWAFDGAVISDWGAAHDTYESAFYGLDLEMGTGTDGLTSEAGIGYEGYFLGKRYLDMCRRGEVPEEVVNDKARRMLRLILRTVKHPEAGRFPSREVKPYGAMNSPEHREAARQIAQEGIVLLKNEDRLLPLTEERLTELHARRIAGKKSAEGKAATLLVVGENATRSLCAGGGSSELKPFDEVSPLRGLQERYGKVAEVKYAKGYASGPSMYGRAEELPQSLYDSLRAEAARMAREADVVVFVGGLNKNHQQDCEGGDRLSYDLPFCQNELISALLEANASTLLVMVSGNAYAMPWLDKAPCLVQSWYLGSEAGHALADVLSGDVCPSGKLPYSIAKNLTDYPAHRMGAVGYPGVRPADLPQPFAGEEGKPLSSADLLRVAVKDWKGMSFPTKRGDGRRGDESEVYGEDILLGYRWFDFFKTSTQFPFGYGQSYTTFSYGKPRIADRTVSIEVTNTGHVEGKETVQFYVGDDKSSVVRPVKELKHFEKILLKPGETRTVTYTIQPEDLCFFDESKHAWVSEPGSFTIFVGASSSDIKCKLPFTLRP